eukprot:355744-Chlamydomonas_euryale.AAC.6
MPPPPPFDAFRIEHAAPSPLCCLPHVACRSLPSLLCPQQQKHAAAGDDTTGGPAHLSPHLRVHTYGSTPAPTFATTCPSARSRTASGSGCPPAAKASM